MEWGLSLLHLKILATGGLAAWLTLAAANNVIDPRTNTHLLSEMMAMAELKRDAVLGQGLLWRSVSSAALPRAILRLVIALQIGIVVLLWRAAYLLGFGEHGAAAVAAANLALGAFASLWFFFLCGGMWFGYWMKMPQVQQVHMMLLLVSLAAMALINI